MNIELLKKELKSSKLIKNIIYLQTVGSTNDYAKTEKINENSLVLAKVQTNGRGQKDHSWYGGTDNIAMTIFLKPNCDISFFKELTLDIGTIICNSLKELYGINAIVKKPNDILCNGKKICGILTETKLDGNIVKELIIGIGLNVNQPEFPEELKEIATSLKIETTKNSSKELIIANICKKLETYHIKL